MSEEIKLRYIDPFGHLTLTEAERLAMFLAGEWVPRPVKWVTLKDVEEMYPTNETAATSEPVACAGGFWEPTPGPLPADARCTVCKGLAVNHPHRHVGGISEDRRRGEAK